MTWLGNINATETPPRAWGRRGMPLYEAHLGRNTPTGVGKTPSGTPKPHQVRKHPHGRGEDASLPPLASWTSETPPRAWGRQRRSARTSSYSGNTPTGVGKTEFAEAIRSARKKHPHGRGEDSPPNWNKSAPVETPPRAWGRQSRR